MAQDNKYAIVLQKIHSHIKELVSYTALISGLFYPLINYRLFFIRLLRLFTQLGLEVF